MIFHAAVGRPNNRYHATATSPAGFTPSVYFTPLTTELTLGLNKASVSDPDTLDFDQAMRDDDRAKWMQAANDEIKALESKGTWVEVYADDAADNKIIPGTWVFRRKRTPSGEVKKHKGRYCVRGDLQEGSFETYAPVVAFPTVRLFLVLALAFNWQTITIDFSNAFVQAELKEPVWIHLPRGFRSSLPGNKPTCLKLIRSLYGLSVAPRLWYQHLFKAFIDLGFVPSQYDPCLLIRSDMLIICYVDDAGIAAADISSIKRLIADLRKRGFELTEEGSFEDYLGIKFNRGDDNRIELTQSGLINKIIFATGLADANPNWTPATQLGLASDPDQPPMRETWSYSSIVGMLLYLSTNTRPDISFAVSQVARFSHSPRQSHATAIKTIVRYLSRTADKGIIMQPTGRLELECYVDADFAGLYNREPDTEPVSVRSRTGFLINVGNCPILWRSQLQTEVSLSTLEAEYSALSQSLRVVLPLHRMIVEISTLLALPKIMKASVSCRVFEDNNGALSLATKQRITSRTKYFLVKWHHFWSAVSSGEITVVKIDTTEQRADYLTKGLPRDTFEKIRKLVQGW
jgi:hypothetical protein